MQELKVIVIYGPTVLGTVAKVAQKAYIVATRYFDNGGVAIMLKVITSM